MTTSTLIREGKVLAAIDNSVYATSVADHAAWAASQLASPLFFIHTIDRVSAPVATDLSGNLAADGKDVLLAELAQVDEQRGRVAQARGRELLEQARRRVLEMYAGESSAQMRHGTLVDTLVELEGDVRLFVIGKRGEHADFAKGHLGSNLERVVRAVHRPVLVTSRAFRPIERFLIAFDGSATTRKCVEMVCASPLLKGAACELLLVGQETETTRGHMEWAKERLRAAGFEFRAHFVEGDPDDVIVETARQFGIDLIVMGAYGHSRIRQLVVGSTTTHVLRHCQIPLLLLR